MTASAASPTRPAFLASILMAAWVGLFGCAGHTPRPAGNVLEPLPTLAAQVPDDTELAVRDLARAVLASDAATADRVISRLEGNEAELQHPSGVLPYVYDARNSLIEDARLYRGATAYVLERDDLTPTLRARLEQEVADDPLLHARDRMRDARHVHYGRIFNALAEPLGRSVTNVMGLAYRLPTALVALLLAEHMEDELTGHERQALAHWKEFIERHPDAPESRALLEKVQDHQARWSNTQRDRYVRRARGALAKDNPAMAAALANRALRFAPDDDDVHELLARARQEQQQQETQQHHSLRAPEALEPAGATELQLARSLLASPGGRAAPIDAVALGLIGDDPKGPLVDEAHYALHIVHRENGDEEAAWGRIGDLAGDDHNMARHARTHLTSPHENPLRFYRRARRKVTTDRLKWLFFGPLSEGAREMHLPRALEYMIVARMVTGFPNRLLRFPFMKVPNKSPGVFARRYLARAPAGEQHEDIRRWLRGHEMKRGNYIGAHQLEAASREPDTKLLARLREQAADQALEVVDRERTIHAQVAVLRRIGREFPETEAAQKAGELLREMLRETTPQRIRVTKGFLTENPEVAGPEGLALQPGLLDDERRNGELHPEGIMLLGSNAIEIGFLAPSGDPRDEAVRERRRISETRMARMVSRIQEADQRNIRTDRDYPAEFDADRDLFFERALLGAADLPHPKPTARSNYTYRGVRERYGLVRGREPILPVELVLQGSFDGLSLGAFPRIRMPKSTADSFLYH